jgi:hypothetical protein
MTTRHAERRKRNIWAKVRVAKAMEQNQQECWHSDGKVEELEKTLNLLDRIRPTIGDSAYEKRVQSLLGALPDPALFSKDVEVIVLDDSSDDDDNKRAKKKKENSNLNGGCDHHSEDDADSTD